MKYCLYVVFDRVAEESGPIFSAVNDGIAQRNVRHMLKDVPPYDRDAYRLYKVGEFDSEAMRLSCEVDPSEVLIGAFGMAEGKEQG